MERSASAALASVGSVIRDFNQVVTESKAGFGIAQQENDEVTGDMLLAIFSALEKHVWMLNSFLGK